MFLGPGVSANFQYLSGGHSSLRKKARGFTLIELVVVSMILAISAAVVVPKWSHSIESAKATSLLRAIEADVAGLQRLSVQRGQALRLTFASDSNQFTISPPQPQFLGDDQGRVSYAQRFPGALFSHTDFNGSQSLDINMYGDLVSPQTGQRLVAGLVTVSVGTLSRSSDLLLSQGTTSIPTPLAQTDPSQFDPQSLEANVGETNLDQQPSNSLGNSTLKYLGKLFGW